MAEVAFSEDGKYFSAISQDGRLKVWDTETNVLKQEYTPDLHLTAPPSCLQWISVTQSASAQKGRRKSISNDETQCIALGTTSGKILIYSVAQAKIESVLEEKNNEIANKNVTSLDWHRKYGLFSSSKENLISEWDLSSGVASYKYNVNIDSKNIQVSNVSAIKIIPHSQKTQAKYLITAATQIRLWRLNSGDAELVKCFGHNASPKALLTVACLNNTCWLVEGSQNERLLSFWDVTVTPDLLPQMNGEDTTPNRKKRKKSMSSPTTVPTPTYNFVLEDAPKQIDVNVRTEENGTKLSLAAVTRSGVVHYYGHMLNGASTKPIKPSVTIQVTTADAQPLSLQCCRLPSIGGVLLGYMQGVGVLFERVEPELKSKTQVLIRGEANESKKQKQNQKKSETNRVKETDNSDVTYVEPMGGVSRKRNTPGAKVEVPMEERLANLSVASRPDAPLSHNLTRLLVQGLHSKDNRLIDSVLHHNKPSIALHTVSGLPVAAVPALLEHLATIAGKRTSQCASVCTWLSSVLRCHSALLLATSGASQNHLTQLLAIFMNRRSHLCQLLNLKGRVELTLSQRKKEDIDTGAQPAVLEYNDSSSEEEMELEEMEAKSESEQSWGASEDGSDSDAS